MVGSLADGIAQKQREKFGEPSEMDKQISGFDRSKYLVIPLSLDGPQTRRVAAILGTLVGDLDQLSRRLDLAPRMRALTLGDYLSSTQHEINRTLGREPRKRTSRDNF